jgi:hypothetical protein
MCQFGPSAFDDTDWRRAAGGLVAKFENVCPFLLQCAGKLLTFAKILASNAESRERHLAVVFCVTRAKAAAATWGKDLGEPCKPSVALGEEWTKENDRYSRILVFVILRNFGTDMITSTWPNREPNGFGCFRQIVAHLGGMTRAWLRHRPIHFVFHGRGICRAILAGGKFLG